MKIKQMLRLSLLLLALVSFAGCDKDEEYPKDAYVGVVLQVYSGNPFVELVSEPKGTSEYGPRTNHTISFPKENFPGHTFVKGERIVFRIISYKFYDGFQLALYYPHWICVVKPYR